MRSSDESLTWALSHVLWLGGSVCAGKSSIARTLGAKDPPQNKVNSHAVVAAGLMV